MEIISGKMFTLSDPIDSIIRTVSTASNQLVHVTLKQSETEPVEVKEEPDGAKSAKAAKSSVQEDHTIRLPSGTVLRIGEEKPEPTKPGRKRKGELVIKEVIESKRPIRLRRVPQKLRKSPDKKAVQKAVSTVRKRLNVERVSIAQSPRKVKVEAVSIEPVSLLVKTETMETKLVTNGTIPVPVPVGSTNGTASIIVENTAKRRTESEEKSEKDTVVPVPTVIAVNPISVTSSTNHVLLTNGPQVQVISRKPTPSTPFLMTDILKGKSVLISYFEGSFFWFPSKRDSNSSL